MEITTTYRPNPAKYQQGKIYQVVSRLTPKIYIGSTINSLSRRMALHRAACRKLLFEGKSSRGINEIFSIDPDCEIVLIENFPCQNKQELFLRERFYIEQMKDICVNVKQPIMLEGDRKLYFAKHYENNREKVIDRAKKYYYDHKDEILSKNKEKITCECGQQMCKSSFYLHIRSGIHFRALEAKKDGEIRRSD